MKGTSHLTVGLATYASLWVHPTGPLAPPLFAGVSSLAVLPVALAVVALGSLLPDLDHTHGMLAGERVVGVRPLRPLAWTIGTVFGHRGPTHSLLALLGVLVLGQWWGFPWAWLNLGWLLGWGYALHLVADALTRAGVPLFWPLPARVGVPPVRRLRFTNGSWREGLIVGVVVLVCLLRLVPA